MKTIKHCNWCKNEATRHDYREVDGMTSKIKTCESCFKIETKKLLTFKNYKQHGKIRSPKKDARND